MWLTAKMISGAVALVATTSLAGAQFSPNWQSCRAAPEIDFDLQIKSCTALIQSITLSKESLAVAFGNRCGAYVNKGQPDRAIEDCNKAIQLDPSNVQAFINRGRAYVQKRLHGLAIQDFDQAIKFEPSNSSVWTSRCWEHAISGQLDLALKDCNESLRLNPGAENTLDSRGLVYLKLGQFDNAIADFDAALKVNAKSVTSLYGRGLAKQGKGDHDAAEADISAAETIKASIAAEYAGYVGTGGPVAPKAIKKNDDTGNVYLVRRELTALKSKPEDRADTVKMLARGEVIVIEGYVPLSSAEQSATNPSDERARSLFWYRARTEDGSRGYIHASSIIDAKTLTSLATLEKQTRAVSEFVTKASKSTGPLAGYAGLYWSETHGFLLQGQGQRRPDGCYDAPRYDAAQVFDLGNPLKFNFISHATMWQRVVQVVWSEGNVLYVTLLGEAVLSSKLTEPRQVKTQFGLTTLYRATDHTGAELSYGFTRDKMIAFTRPNGQGTVLVSIRCRQLESQYPAFKKEVEAALVSFPAKFSFEYIGK